MFLELREQRSCVAIRWLTSTLRRKTYFLFCAVFRICTLEIFLYLILREDFLSVVPKFQRRWRCVRL